MTQAEHPQTVEGRPHAHEWQANGTVENDRISHSPVSMWDDVLYTDVLAVQSCACGEVKKVPVGRRNVRTRHEEYQRRKAVAR
jgi:hypothetical protein